MNLSKHVTHYIFYHDKELLDKACQGPLSENFVTVNVNDLSIPQTLRVKGLSDDQIRAGYSKYLGILSLNPTSDMVGLFDDSIPLKFSQKHAHATGCHSVFLPEIRFQYFKESMFDENKLYGVEFNSFSLKNGNLEDSIIAEIDEDPRYSLSAYGSEWIGPLKGTVIVRREVFLEFQKWLLGVIVYLLGKHGFYFRGGIASVLERLMAYYFGRRYSQRKRVDLRFFLDPQSLLKRPDKIKIYALCTPSHRPMMEKFFLPSLPEFFDLVIEEHGQECPSGTYNSPGWMPTVFKKILQIEKAITDNFGGIFVYSDADVQFFDMKRSDILDNLADKDIVFQRDFNKKPFDPSIGHNGPACIGFFIIRANQRTLNLWRSVKELCLKNQDCNDYDQRAMNIFLRDNADKVNWGFLPESFYNASFSLCKSNGITPWEPGVKLRLPKKVIMHHANWTEGVSNKTAMLEYIRSKVSLPKIIIILPYYCQEEVALFGKLVNILSHWGGLDRVEFLLSARYDCPKSQALYEICSKLAPTTSIQCSMEGKGIVNPETGFNIEGPSGMFLDTMQFIDQNYPLDGGFALWMEADMVPLREDWLKAFNAEWSAELVMMGFLCFSPISRWPRHINGGACYAKDFFRKVSPENFQLKASWDLQVLQILINKGLAYKFINSLIDFRHKSSELYWLPDKQFAILHGVKDDTAHQYLEKRYHVTPHPMFRGTIKEIAAKLKTPQQVETFSKSASIYARIQGVSFPYSGSGAQIKCLFDYIAMQAGKKADRVERDGLLIVNDFGYCDYYKHCQQSPCTDSRVVIQKQSDIDFTLKNNSNDKYLIQIGDPLQAIIAWFEGQLAEKRKGADILEEYSQESWENFALDKAMLWNQFVKKWVLSHKNQNTLVVWQDDFLLNPSLGLEKIIRFVKPDENIDKSLLQKVIKNNNLDHSKDPEAFSFYNEEFFCFLKGILIEKNSISWPDSSTAKLS